MAKQANNLKDNPKLLERQLKDGRISLYLEYYLGRRAEPILDKYGDPILYEEGEMAGKPKYKISHIRRKENLNLYLISNPRTPIERNTNKETRILAERIRYERSQSLLEDREGYRIKKQSRINFLDYFQKYIDGYTKKDKRMVQMALNRFKEFLSEAQEYSMYKDFIKPEQITKTMVQDYTEYLQSRGYGEGPHSIYERFKKVIKYAFEHDLIKKNPCQGVTITIDRSLKKDILSQEEIERLIETKCETQSKAIRSAFIFCLFSGLRFCDVKDLTFSNVDYSNRLLKFEQNKTRGHSASSWVIIPLNESLLFLIGKPEGTQTKDSHIFALPSYEMCSKSLKRWVERAGIEKHISWHCARHSFAVNILNNGANIKTVASLLGHSGLQHTEKYTRAVDELKARAIDSLPLDITKI